MRHTTEKKIPIICLLGPTGAGKTALAILLARKFNGLIINADSRQVYADFPLITAQPNAAEQAACPHRLYGFMRTEETIHAGSFLTLAAQEIAAAQAAQKIPFLVGGTGLYIRALCEGLAPIPTVPEAVSLHWREKGQELGSVALHQELKTVDPETASRLHPNDMQRVSRALEVYTATGKTLSAWHTLPVVPSPYAYLKLCLMPSLPELTPRLAQRIGLMLEQGAIAEAEQARRWCDCPNAPGWSAIGCAELYLHLSGVLPLDACKELWLKNTRAYAKRQLTWFRSEKNCHHYAAPASSPLCSFDEMAASIASFLQAQ